LLDTCLEYTPQNFLEQALQQINHRLENIDQQMRIGLAQKSNTGMISRNAADLRSTHPLQKTVSPTVELSYMITLFLRFLDAAVPSHFLL
jgi:hypothetical protein